MQNNINSFLNQIVSLKQQGKNPQAVLQMLIQRNPQYQQTLQQLKNMSNGRNPQEFIMQLAQQNGVSPENIQAIQQIIGK